MSTRSEKESNSNSEEEVKSAVNHRITPNIKFTSTYYFIYLSFAKMSQHFCLWLKFKLKPYSSVLILVYGEVHLPVVYEQQNYHLCLLLMVMHAHC